MIMGVVVTGMLALSSGCAAESANKPGTTSGGAGATSSAPTPSLKPTESFANAVSKLNGQNAKYTISEGAGGAINGYFDAASGGTKLTGDIDGSKMEVIVLGDDVYLGGLAGGGKWMRAKASKFKDSAISFLILVDPLFGQKFLSTAADVKQDQPATYSGTVDLTKVTVTGPAKRIADSFAKAAGAGATALPFTATVDAAGVLSTVKMTFPKADLVGKDLKYDLKLTEVGASGEAVAAPPKDKVTEAPADIYKGP